MLTLSSRLQVAVPMIKKMFFFIRMTVFLNKQLHKRIQEEAKVKFKTWPSAYASVWVVRQYKKRGGKFKETSNLLARWFDEKWVNICKANRPPCGRMRNTSTYPLCRPTKKISRQTPKLAKELTLNEIKRLCKMKIKKPEKKINFRTCIKLKKSTRKNKKYMVKFSNCMVHFGCMGYSDFTKHKDENRKARYLKRHAKQENWTRSGICTAGFWSRYILWNEKTIKASKEDVQRRFNIKFC